MKLFTLLAWGLITIFLSPGAEAREALPSCAFRPREMLESLMSQMPKPVIGYANCKQREPLASVFYVAKFEKPTEAELKTFLLDYAKVIVASGNGTKVTKSQQRPDGTFQFTLETNRGVGKESMTHVAFTAQAKLGETHLFVHTAGAKQTQRLRASLADLGKHLTGEFAALLEPISPMVSSNLPESAR